MKQRSSKPVRKQVGPIKGFQALPEDLRIMDDLRAKLELKQGPISDTALLRMALRALAEAQGLNALQQ